MYYIQINFNSSTHSSTFPTNELASKWLASMLTTLYEKYGLNRASYVQISGHEFDL